MQKEHTEHGPSRLSCDQCDRSVNSSHATVPKTHRAVEFYRRQRQTGSMPGLGWEHLVMVLLSTFKVYLFSSYSLKTQKILDKLIGLL